MPPEITAAIKLLWVAIQHLVLRRPENECTLDVSQAEAAVLYDLAIEQGWRAMAVRLLEARASDTNQS